MPPSVRFRSAHVVAALAYLLLSSVGGFMTEHLAPIGPFRPAAGVGLAACIRLGDGVFRWIAPISAAVAYLGGAPLPAAIASGAIDTLVLFVAARILRRVRFQSGLERNDDVVALSAVAVVAPLPGALLAAAVPGLLRLYAPYSAAFPIAWLGDCLGILAAAPVFLTAPSPYRLTRPDRPLEAGALGCLLAFVVWSLFFADLPAAIAANTNVLLLFPLLIWAAMRFGPPGAARASLVVAVGAHLGAGLGSGPFAAQRIVAGEFGLQLFMAVAIVTSLLLASMNAERQRMQARLSHSQRLASLGTLAAGIAHEINNPLAFLTSNLQFVADSVDLRKNPTLQSAIEDALEGAGRIRDLVADLSIFSRSTAGAPTTLRLEEPVHFAVRMVSRWIESRAELHVEEGPTPRVRGDAGRIGQVVLNLLMNAAQAIPADASVRQIHLRTFTAPDGRAAIEVRDSGCGIPPEVLPRIFDPFFTTKPVGKGTGLGLSICHEIVAAAGGEIQVESELGRGTTMRVLLPAATPCAETTPGARAA